MRFALPRSFYNLTSLIGTAIAAISFLLILFVVLLEITEGRQKPYAGVIAFVILPVFLFVGLFVALVGMLRERRRLVRGGAVERFPRIDLNDPRQRRFLGLLSLLTLLLLLSSAYGSYRAYEYTDSVEFCGETCHSVMKPEYTAYKVSPHARITCAECHVGPGPGHYLRAKLAGAHQVYSVMFDKYPRPIPAPVEDLRPARETCEQCHWPKYFFPERHRVFQYFLSDEQNTPWTIMMLMKIGGGNIESGPTSGIHWHMNIANEITYIAADPERRVIPWVRSKSLDGTVREYVSTDSPPTAEQLARGQSRRLDCMDCHNRSAHAFQSPNEAVHQSMSLNWISSKLPSIKSIAVGALVQEYETQQEAFRGIQDFVESEYQSRYPEVYRSTKSDIQAAVTRLRKIFSQTFFPEMKVSWKAYPDHLGHLNTPGCFRCHDGKHVSSDGKAISRDCNLCHTFLSQGPDISRTPMSMDGLPFQHPLDIGESWIEMNCSDCHPGDEH